MQGWHNSPGLCRWIFFSWAIAEMARLTSIGLFHTKTETFEIKDNFVTHF